MAQVASDFALPQDLREAMARLYREGFNLLPLGGRDGKSPILKLWAAKRPTLGQVFGPMRGSGSLAYGIRLDGLAVIDCDDDSAELVAAMEARFGPSPVHVKTPRGRHLYYRAQGIAPNLRGEGFPVDIKTGAHAYVVGPHSLRPDGGLYLTAKGLLGKDALPLLRAPQGPQSAPKEQDKAEPIPVGHRHVELVREAIRMVEYVDGAEELVANLEAVRDDLCADAETMPDSELRDIAKWAWECRLNNRVYRGRDSAFPLHRSALDALRGWENQSDSLALYVMLVDMHGHVPGKRFALDFTAMRASGLTGLSIPRLREARRTLEAMGLLTLVTKHRAGARHQTFALSRPRPTDAPNVESLPIPQGPGKVGGRG